jgi:hypothetical protein
MKMNPNTNSRGRSFHKATIELSKEVCFRCFPQDLWAVRMKPALCRTSLFLLLAVGIVCGLATSLAPAQNQPPATAPFTAQVKKAVVFIQTDCHAPQGIESHVGTGFLLWMPEPRLGADLGFTYLNHQPSRCPTGNRKLKTV